MEKAIAIVNGIIAVPEVGKVYEGKVKTITDFGAFIEFLPGKDGLLHISEISWKKLPSMEGVFEDGEEVKVQLIEVDKRSGKYRLSRKVLLPRPEGMPEPTEEEIREQRERRESRDRGGDRGRGDSRGRDNRGGGRDNRGGGRDNRDNRGGDRRDNRDRDNRDNRSNPSNDNKSNNNPATDDAYKFDDM